MVHYHCSRKYVNAKALTTKDKQASHLFFEFLVFDLELLNAHF